MKIGISCYFIADILTKDILGMFVEWSSTDQSYTFVQTSQYGNQKAKIAKNIKKSTPRKLFGG